MRHPAILILLLLLLAAARPAVAAFPASCPSSQASMRNVGVATLEASVFDSVTTDGAGLVYRVSYDLPQGRVFTAQPGCLCGAWVEAVDLFDVTGVPVGTSVPLTAMLTMDGTVSGPCNPQCGGDVDCRISSGALQDEKNVSVPNPPSTTNVHDVASIPVTIMAGTPVEIRYYVFGHQSLGGANSTTTGGLLSFSGLPRGSVIVSCRGYSSAGATAARPTSWGALKAIYR